MEFGKQDIIRCQQNKIQVTDIKLHCIPYDLEQISYKSTQVCPGLEDKRIKKIYLLNT